MNVFPAFFQTADRIALVAGGGESAARKVRLLLKTEIVVRVYSEKTPTMEIRSLARDGRITLVRHAPVIEDLTNVAFAIVALDDENRVLATVSLLRAAKIPTNVVDRPDLGDFTVPAMVDRGDIAIGIATGGTAPILARKIRQSIETVLPQRVGALTDFARSFRGAVARTLPTGRARKTFWECIFDGPIGAAVLDGREAEARSAMLSALNRDSVRSSAGGHVALVGAGPGDPELLTVKALNVLQKADIVYYDNLVSDGVLDLVRRDAERVYVGKRKGNHAVSQTDIQDLIIQSARNGLFVVRLKGGDPFVFGRGGEEIATVKAAGIPVEIVPGITAATGAGAAAAIPLTHRDYAQAVTFVTGHDRHGLPDLDWQALSAERQTVVVYMGVGTAGQIAENLIAAGAPADRPVAVIENATLPLQRTVHGRLGQLRNLVSANGIEGPALIVIGEVAAAANAVSDIAVETAVAV